MQLQRNYTLPNCTLTLEGMSDPSKGLTPGAPMTILVNAVCQFLGQKQPLSGGSDFFNSLVATASSYAQEQLSGIRSQLSRQGLVQMQRLESGLHEISVYQEEQAGNDPALRTELSTVQLFDLVEAIDQFLADGTALPEMKLAIAPLAKRDVPSQEPMAQRVAAPALGVAGLAIAAAALFALPAPEITRPVDGEGTQVESLSENEGDETAAGGASGDDELVLETPDNLITDEIVVGAIQADLENQLNSAWTESLGTEQDLTYRVTTSEDGTVLGYEPLDEISREYESQTPLLDSLYIPADGGRVADQPLAQFKVSFIGDRDLEVEPFTVEDLSSSVATSEQATFTTGESLESAEEEADSDEPDLTQADAESVEADGEELASDGDGDSAADSESLVEAESLSASEAEDLTTTLYNAIDETWTKSPSFDGALEYRVQVSPDGEVVGFEALTADGRDFASDIPLGELKTSANPDQVADFKVLFKSSGVLEVSPWDGF